MRPARQAEFIEDEPLLLDEWVPYMLTALPDSVLDRVVESWQPQGDPNRVRCTITMREALSSGSERHVTNGTLRQITPLGLQCQFGEIFGRGKDPQRFTTYA